MSRRSKNLSPVWLIFLVTISIFSIFYLYSETTNDSSVSNYPTTTKPLPTITSLSPHIDKNWYEVYFTSPKIPFDEIYTGGIENNLIAKIDASQKSIDLAVFEFDIESVAQALIKAQQRGVMVRVVYDDEHTNSDPQIKELQAAGIATIPDNRTAYMHNKFFIFDNLCIWTGSFNISMNAAYHNNENALFFCSVKVSKNYETEFAEMFSGQFGPESPPDTPYPVFSENGITIENYFAPEDEVMDKIIKTLLLANSSIHFMAFSFTDDQLAQTIIAKSQQGVVVEGIFETTGANTEYSKCQKLLQNGLDIRLDGNPRTFHHKVIIVDKKTVILGSFNYSANANTQNDENLLIVHDTSLAQEYEAQFQKMKFQAFIPLNGFCQK